MKVNGKTVDLEKPVKLEGFLESSGYNLGRVAVELNGSIVPKTFYGDTTLSPEDTLEIVSFVGGG